MRRQPIPQVILLIFLTALTFPSAQAQESAASRYQALTRQMDEAYNQGRYGEAVPLAQQAYQLARETFGKKDPNTLASMNNPGVSVRETGPL